MLILDTHIWFWWVQDPASLSKTAHDAITAAEADGEILVSAVSVWEIALKARAGRIDLSSDIRSWVADAMAYPGITCLPLEAEDGLNATLLPGSFHRDPADRFLLAIARRLNVPIVTTDRLIIAYPFVEKIT